VDTHAVRGASGSIEHIMIRIKSTIRMKMVSSLKGKANIW